MKRNLIFMGASAGFLTLTSIVARLLAFTSLTFGQSFAIGCVLLVVGFIMLALWVKRKVIKCIVIALNAIAMGFLLRAWYINRGFDNSLWLMLFVVALASVYFLIATLPLLIPCVNRHKAQYLSILDLLSIVAFAILVKNIQTTWVSTLGYFGLIQIGFVICLAFNENIQLEKALLASTYTVAICAVIILVIVLSLNDGSGILDGLDVSSSSNGSPKKKTKTPPTDMPQK